MKIKNHFFAEKKFIFLLVLLFANDSFAENLTQISRYTTLQNKINLEQQKLLFQTVQIKFPPTIKTVGEGVDYLLRFSGYTQVNEKDKSKELKIILKKPLPLIHREIGPASLQEALLTLVGPAFNLKEDVINRTINFKLKPLFRKEI